MNDAVSTKVLELFEKHRKTPGAEFDESRIFDFLQKRPKAKGAFRNSFSGLRRFNAFWDDVQMEFGVCFSMKDWETNYSLDRFSARIEELRKSMRSSKASLKNRASVRFEWNIFIFGNVMLVAIALGLQRIEILSAIIWLGVVLLNYVLVASYLKERKYIKRLEARILDEADMR